jgi:uncharacterized OsmC-like protein
MESRSLRSYLKQKGDAMRAAALRRPASADWLETVEATCVADDATGVRRLRIRDWQFISDSGPDFGGWSLGPSSPELLCGVLSTCLTHTYEIAAAAMNIPLDRIEVRVTAKNNDARFVGVETGDPALPWDITAHVHLEADGVPPPDLERLHTFARECCPLTQLIRTPNAMTIVTES